jgi:glycosyltransferase involved in cell wall biosynthesis
VNDPRSPSILCDFWYANELPVECTLLDDQSRSTKGYSRKEKILRPFRLAARARHFDVVIPNWYQYGILYLAIGLVMGRRNTVLLEFIDYRLKRHNPAVRLVYGILQALVIGPAMRRTVRAIQVMTEAEADAIARRYGIDRSRISVIRWSLAGSVGSAIARDPDPSAAPYVFSSGRAACDWETLFAAAEQSAWPLVVVCSSADEKRVATLNRSGRATILTEIPLAEHDRLLAQATVCAVVLREEGKSSGQVRLGTCIAAGVPAVVTEVEGLKGYLVDQITGHAVPANDPEALRAAIDLLMADPAKRQALVEAGRQETATYTREDYFANVAAMLRDAGADGKPAGTGK